MGWGRAGDNTGLSGGGARCSRRPGGAICCEGGFGGRAGWPGDWVEWDTSAGTNAGGGGCAASTARCGVVCGGSGCDAGSNLAAGSGCKERGSGVGLGAIWPTADDVGWGEGSTMGHGLRLTRMGCTTLPLRHLTGCCSAPRLAVVFEVVTACCRSPCPSCCRHGPGPSCCCS